jgi:hypothetical protein
MKRGQVHGRADHCGNDLDAMIDKCFEPFTYSARQRAAIRRELPSLPAISGRQLWSTICARRIPLIVGGGEVRPRDPKWARTMLERQAREFLAFEAACYRRRDAAAAERRACKEASHGHRRRLVTELACSRGRDL